MKRVPKGDSEPPKCGYVKPSKPLKMARHVSIVPENITYYKCELCGFAATKEIILKRHIGNLHGPVKQENSKLEKPATPAPKHSSNKKIKEEISEKAGMGTRIHSTSRRALRSTTSALTVSFQP